MKVIKKILRSPITFYNWLCANDVNNDLGGGYLIATFRWGFLIFIIVNVIIEVIRAKGI